MTEREMLKLRFCRRYERRVIGRGRDWNCGRRVGGCEGEVVMVTGVLWSYCGLCRDAHRLSAFEGSKAGDMSPR